MGQRERWHTVEQRCHHPCHPGLMSESLTLLECRIVLPACVLILLRYLWDEFYATNAAQSSKNRG